MHTHWHMHTPCNTHTRAHTHTQCARKHTYTHTHTWKTKTHTTCTHAHKQTQVEVGVGEVEEEPFTFTGSSISSPFHSWCRGATGADSTGGSVRSSNICVHRTSLALTRGGCVTHAIEEASRAGRCTMESGHKMRWISLHELIQNTR